MGAGSHPPFQSSSMMLLSLDRWASVCSQAEPHCGNMRKLKKGAHGPCEVTSTYVQCSPTSIHVGESMPQQRTERDVVRSSSLSSLI